MTVQTLVKRSKTKPIRTELSWEEKWRGPDMGLITCWEVGRELSSSNPELATRSKNGELPSMHWKGGVERKIKDEKFGTLKYLAQWQGLRGEDLNINLAAEISIICSRTNMEVTFTSDSTKYSKS
jgi:hypothetical protein